MSRRQSSLSPSDSSALVTKEGKRQPEKKSAEIVLREMLLKNYTYDSKFIPKSKWQVFRSRTFVELVAEIKDLFLMGKEHHDLQVLLKGFLYSPEYASKHYVPRKLFAHSVERLPRRIDLLVRSPLVTAFEAERRKSAKEMAVDLLTLWGLLRTWMRDAREQLDKFKKEVYRFSSAVGGLQQPMNRPSFREKIDTLDKRFQFLSLLRLEFSLKELISSLNSDEEKKGTAEKNSAAVQGGISGQELKEVLPTPGKLKEIIEAARAFEAKARRVLAIEDHKVEEPVSAAPVDPMLSKEGMMRSAEAQLKTVSLLLETIKRDAAATEWSHFNQSSIAVTKSIDSILPPDLSIQSLKRFLDDSKPMLQDSVCKLAAISAQVVHDGPAAVSVDELITRLTSSPEISSKFLEVQDLAEGKSLLSMYTNNVAYFCEVDQNLHSSMEVMERLTDWVGIEEELEALDGLTDQFNEMKGQFKFLNRSSKCLTTIMKFLIYFQELRPELDELFKEQVEGKENKKAEEKEGKEEMKKEKAELPIADDIGLRKERIKLFRGKLEQLAEKLAEQYSQENKGKVIQFLSTKIQPLISIPEGIKQPSNLTEICESARYVLTSACEFLFNHHQRACDLFGKKRSTTELLPGWFSAQQVIASGGTINYRDADFLTLLAYPTVEAESQFWAQEQKKNSVLCVGIPDANHFRHKAFNDGLRNEYNARERLLSMVDVAQKGGYSNPLLRPILECFFSSTEFGLKLAQLVDDCQKNEKLYLEQAKVSAEMQAAYKAMIQSAGSYLATLDNLSQTLAKASLTGVSAQNLKQLLEDKLKVLHDFHEKLHLSFIEDFLKLNDGYQMKQDELKRFFENDHQERNDSVYGEEIFRLFSTHPSNSGVPAVVTQESSSFASDFQSSSFAASAQAAREIGILRQPSELEVSHDLAAALAADPVAADGDSAEFALYVQ